MHRTEIHNAITPLEKFRMNVNEQTNVLKTAGVSMWCFLQENVERELCKNYKWTQFILVQLRDTWQKLHIQADAKS